MDRLLFFLLENRTIIFTTNSLQKGARNRLLSLRFLFRTKNIQYLRIYLVEQAFQTTDRLEGLLQSSFLKH